MLKVQEYLKSNSLKELKDEYDLKIKEYDNGLILLDYSITSPKTAQITIECRSLILDQDFNIVSRKFNRFFNYGENESQNTVDLNYAVALEKADGSIIGIYYYKNEWLISTRGMALAEGPFQDTEKTFKEMVLLAFGYNEEQFQEAFNQLDKDNTYIFEYISLENRIVTKYEKPEMVLIGISENSWTDYYSKESGFLSYTITILNNPNIRLPIFYPVINYKQLCESVDNLGDLKEGYVIWDSKNNTRLKIKSKTYLLAHGLKGDLKVTKKRLYELAFIGDVEEFLCYFPEYTDRVNQIVISVDKLLKEAQDNFDKFNVIIDQKEFALMVKVLKYSSLLFTGRKTGDNIRKVFDEMNLKYKMQLFVE